MALAQDDGQARSHPLTWADLLHPEPHVEPDSGAAVRYLYSFGACQVLNQ